MFIQLCYSLLWCSFGLNTHSSDVQWRHRFCVCVHLHFKLAPQHVAAIFFSQSFLCRIGLWSIRLLSLFQDSCGRENPKPISCFFIIIGWFSVKEIQSDLHSGVHWQNHVAAHGTALSADHCRSSLSLHAKQVGVTKGDGSNWPGWDRQISKSFRVGVIITRDGPDTPAAAGI